jgi:hypothetical protein
MAHFAKLDNDNVITDVIVVRNEDIVDSNGDESESIGIAYCQNLFGENWVQTSYNNNFRKQYTSIGFTYDADADVFIRPQGYSSWVLNDDHDWEPPYAAPDDGKHYMWDEASDGWEEIPYDALPPTLKE